MNHKISLTDFQNKLSQKDIKLLSNTQKHSLKELTKLANRDKEKKVDNRLIQRMQFGRVGGSIAATSPNVTHVNFKFDSVSAPISPQK